MIMEVSWIEDGKAQIGDGVARGFKHGNKVIQRSMHQCHHPNEDS